MKDDDRYYYFDHDSRSFVEIKSKRPSKWQYYVALFFFLSVITLGLWQVVHFIQASQESTLVATVEEQNAVIDSLQSALRRDTSISPVLQSSGTISGRLRRLDSMQKEIVLSLREYDVAFRDIREFGVEKAFAVPILQQRVSNLNQKISWLWQMYWATLAGVVGALVSFYFVGVRKHFVETGNRVRASKDVPTE